MNKFIKLIRLPNLIIMALTMFAMRYLVIYPFVTLNGFKIQLNIFLFLSLILATVLIAAGGYAINDYEDFKIDAKNKPEKVTDEKRLNAKNMMTAYNYLTISGITFGGIASYFIGNFMFTTIFVLVAGLLWFYSSTYKMMPFFGNVIVGLLSGLVPVIVALYEIPLLTANYNKILIENNTNLMPLFYFILGFGVFAFLFTIPREIIKDIEDIEGDKTYKKNTLPVAIGPNFSKAIAIFFVILNVFGLMYMQFHFNFGKLSFWYIIIGLVIPMLYIAVRIILDKTPEQIHITSLLFKVVMIIGICYSFVVFYNFTY